ncbi:MAG: hypothetical protein A2Y24_07560 [Clostridiales bacterium GWE2_32_10]|nr:MAG: hypothetical protein A2Y24_07560 [Clostridiales bacterium GWE2_32_10]HBY20568.1 hypothetical protein [Clostridiales bacterium]
MFEELTNLPYIDVIEEIERRGLTKLPLIGRDKEMLKLIQMISSKEIRNVVITGMAGCGKSSFADAIAMIISDKETSKQLPKVLQEKDRISKNILKISGADFKAGSILNGQMEGKVKKIIEVAIRNNAIIFIDEIHSLPKEVLNVFKPYLDGSQDVCIIGTSTAGEYNKFIHQDHAFKRRFQELKLPELDKEDTKAIIIEEALKDEVYIPTEVADYLVNAAGKHIKDSTSPARELKVFHNAVAMQVGVDLSGIKNKYEQSSRNSESSGPTKNNKKTRVEINDEKYDYNKNKFLDCINEYDGVKQDINENILKEFRKPIVKNRLANYEVDGFYLENMDKHIKNEKPEEELPVIEDILKFFVSRYQNSKDEKYLQKLKEVGITIKEGLGFNKRNLETLIVYYAIKKEKMEKMLPKQINMSSNEESDNLVESKNAELASNVGISISKEDIITVISNITNLPRVFLDKDPKKTREFKNQVMRKINERVIGQEHVTDIVVKKIVSYMMGMKDDNKPILTGLFAGPTGVGKTEMAKAIAENIFGSEKSMIRIDMSEYTEEHSVSKIIGAPPGYVGHGETETLADKIRQTPNAVVLFDEMEKAHPNVLKILLQLLDEGRLTDSKGDTVDFTSSIVLLTTNLMFEQEQGKAKKRMGFTMDNTEDKSKQASNHELLAKIISPEYANRIDIIEKFNSMDLEMALNILEKYIKLEQKKFAESGINVTVSDIAKAEIIAGSNIEAFGGRELHRSLSSCTQNMLEMYIDGDIEGENIHIDCEPKSGKYVYSKPVVVQEEMPE